MHEPYDIDIVDGLLASALRSVLDAEQRESADPPYVAETLATQLLTCKHNVGPDGYDGSIHLIAGFRLAVSLCCRVFADPLRSDSNAVRRDVDRSIRWLHNRGG